MALREIGEDGRTYDVTRLSHKVEFDATWSLISAPDQARIENEINCRLDTLIASPDPNWGSITNTSIEGGKTNPATGIRGDWRGTVFQPIYEDAVRHARGARRHVLRERLEERHHRPARALDRDPFRAHLPAAGDLARRENVFPRHKSLMSEQEQRVARLPHV